jgi:hypothetical protein
MKKIIILAFLSVLLYSTSSYAQKIKYMVPDTGRQQLVFPITISGSQTFWTASSYVAVYFDSNGVTATNPVIVNDTTLTAQLNIGGMAAVGYRKITVGDQFLNYVSKDSALLVRLNVPIAPSLLLPQDYATLISPGPLFKWDTNGYATQFRLQVALDSLFNNKVIDTQKANIHGYQSANVLVLNTNYFWRVRFFNSVGGGAWSDTWHFKTAPTSLTIVESGIPKAFKLYNNYPNPFNPATKIKFDIPFQTNVRLTIFDINGREMKTLVNGNFASGSYEYQWNAETMASGIYFCHLQTDSYSESVKMLLIK